MKYVLIITLCALSAFSLFAQDSADFDETRYQISDKYQSGNHLIYDCDDMHWVCVIKEDFDNCYSRTAKALRTGRHRLDCVSESEYESPKDCHKRQLELVKESFYPRFCINPNERKRFIGFE